MGSDKDQSCLTSGASRSRHHFLTLTRRDDSEVPFCRQSPTKCKWKQFLPWHDSKQEFIFLTLQFFHQYFLFSLAALVSNCEAPACNASARLSSSDSFWSLSSTLSTFILMMSTTCEDTDPPETAPTGQLRDTHLFTPWNVTPHPKPSLLPLWCVAVPQNPSLWNHSQWASLCWMRFKAENKETSWNTTVSFIKVFDFFYTDTKPDEDLYTTIGLTLLRTSHYFPCTFNTSLTWSRETSQIKATLKGTVCISLPKHFLILQILWAWWLLSHDLKSCLKMENVLPEQIQPKEQQRAHATLLHNQCTIGKGCSCVYFIHWVRWKSSFSKPITKWKSCRNSPECKCQCHNLSSV